MSWRRLFGGEVYEVPDDDDQFRMVVSPSGAILGTEAEVEAAREKGANEEESRRQREQERLARQAADLEEAHRLERARRLAEAREEGWRS